MERPRKTKDRVADVDRKLGLLLAEVNGYGCKDMTHLSEVRARWHLVEKELDRARAELRHVNGWSALNP